MKKYIVLLFGLVLAVATQAGPATSVEGLWVSDVALERPAGDIVLTRDNGQWAATFDGEAGQTQETKDGSFLVRFATHGTQLRGRADATGVVQQVFWIQPGDQGQDLAMPVTMQASGKGTWRGHSTALDLRFTLYANIFRRDDGLLIAAFRNPQRNTRGGAPRLFVEQHGFAIAFLDNNEGKPGIRHDGTIALDGSTITMPWAETGATITLHRATQAETVAYYPRGKGAVRYSYAKPARLADGWQVANARDTGMDEARLAGAVQKILDVDPSGRKPDLVHALLVASRGRLVMEEYFYGQKRADLHDLRSAGKTLSSVMLGTLLRDGTIADAGTPVMPILRTRFDVANPSAAKDSITLAHLMTHMSGLACNDNDEHSPGGEDAMQGQPQANWWKYIADLPVVAPPGTRYAYCSGGMNLVGAALTLKSGLWLPMLFDREIAGPLQFGPYAWNLSPDGEGYMGGGARMAPRDLLKIGQLYLNRGVWNGRRVVPESWVDTSTAPKVSINEQSTGLDSETLHNTYPGGADGYAWHIFDITAGGRTWRSYEAAGNGGQMVVVVPELSLVVAMNGGNYNQGFIWGRWRDDIIGGHIIPAIIGR